MLNFLAEIGVAVLTFVLTTLAINWARPLGGLVYAIPPYLMVSRIRFISKLLEKLLNGPIYASFLFKAAGYVISASGAIQFLLISHLALPNIGSFPGFYWGVLLACLCSTLHVMHGIHLMQIHSFIEIIDHILASKRLGVDLSQLDTMSRMRLARVHYTDQAMIELLLVIASYGAIVFCTGIIFGTISAPSLVEVGKYMEQTMAFLRFIAISSQAFQPSNIPHHVIAAFYGICLLHFLSFYISLSSKLIDEDISDTRIAERGEDTSSEHFARDVEQAFGYALSRLEKEKEYLPSNRPPSNEKDQQ